MGEFYMAVNFLVTCLGHHTTWVSEYCSFWLKWAMPEPLKRGASMKQSPTLSFFYITNLLGGGRGTFVCIKICSVADVRRKIHIILKKHSLMECLE